MKSLRRRPSRAIPSAIVLLLALIIGLGFIWAGIQKLSTGQWWPQLSSAADSASSASWNSPWGWVAAIVAAVLGLILLLCAFLPGGFNAAQLKRQQAASGHSRGPVDAVVSNRGLATLASSAASQVDGVSGVKSSATAKRVLVNVTTPLHETTSLEEEVRAAVEERLASADLVRFPKVRVSAQSKDVS
ncbi:MULTISPECIES: DUF6286 domain-containing protein [Micrococcaceae]|uniref:DUF6286 domain-containing protein n=1 Tax=unclassified Kocuria TaxID=2649579 RepID=UPI00101199C3|nr:MULTISPECIES: DUF6286 domain-containing protein [unclassified Kocuria]